MSDIDKRDIQNLSKAYKIASNVVMKNYLRSLTEYQIANNPNEKDISKIGRLFKINQLVHKKGEDIFLKLATVYNSVASTGSAVILIIDSKGNDNIDFYVGIRNSDITQGIQKLSNGQKSLQKSFEGNFFGSSLKRIDANDISNLVDDIFLVNKPSYNVISAVSGVATIRNKEKTENKKFIQGIEKFIDAMKDSTYTALFIADSLSNNDIVNIRLGYEELFSTLLPFSKSQYTFNESESKSINESLAKGVFDSVAIGTTLTQSHTISEANTKSSANTFGGGFGFNINQSNSNGLTGSINLGLKSLGLGIAATAIKALGIGANLNFNYSHTSGKSHTNTKSNTDSKSKSESNTTGKSSTETTGTSTTDTTGKSLQIEYVDKTVVNLLERIDQQLKRIKESEDYGIFNCSAYFMSTDKQSSIIAANTYKALMIGEESSVEASAINTWSNEEDVKKLNEYLRRFMHPIINVYVSENEYIPYTTGSIISGLELPLHLGLPQKSVGGLPVIEYAEFGRNVVRYTNDSDNKFELGNIVHMNKDEASTVNLDVKSMTMHTFITGSTGSGKSNTIYSILSSLRKKQIKFLIVEPTKGEYKNIFGKDKDVFVFGTNPKKTPLLKINPFKFPDDIHILEHIDRLIEIFNACWPMYAAMPAILKDAVESAYITVGWDLEISENKYYNNLFPTFSDIFIELTKVINESSFSQELKDNYIGALITRIKSLTNGINGQIFCCDEIDNKILFDSNTIVDLSRVGSTETKAMIMGILVMRLQEYRIVQEEMNSNLKHITVLEEAHNLLKRTSTEQSSESSNLQGKAVEMLANIIAEVRTYGEGFIIADQSPRLLDMSVIRNTNTKIIMRLPDLSDRELVGKSAGLNDDQIAELSKLPTGVATVYQNDWIEAVLCHIPKFEFNNYVYNYNTIYKTNDKDVYKRDIIKYLLSNVVNDKIEYTVDHIDTIKEYILNSNLNTELKLQLINTFKIKPNTIKEVSNIIYKLFNSNEMFEKAKNCNDIEQWNKTLIEFANPSIEKLDNYYKDVILQCLIKEIDLKNSSNMYEKWIGYMNMRGNLI